MKNLTILLIALIFFKGNIFSQVSNNHSLNFDGTNDYANIDVVSSSLANDNSFTIEFWMKADLAAQSQSRVAIFSVNPNPGDNKFMILMGGTGTTQDGKIIVYDEYAKSSPKYAIVSDSVVGDTICHHIAYVRNGSVAKLYIDGVVAGSHTPYYSLASSDRYSLGQEWDLTTTSDFYNGNLDEVRIWNFAKSLSQIQAEMNTQLTGNEFGLISCYGMDQGIAFGNNSSQTTLLDVSTNSFDGALNNFALNGTSSNFITIECMQSNIGNYSDVLNFDGVNDYVNLNSVASSLANDNTFTVEFWMNADRSLQTQNRVAIFSVNPNPGDNKFMLLLGGTGTVQEGRIIVFDQNAGAGNRYAIVSDTVGDSTCHHIAYVRNNSTGSLYIDGVLSGSHTPYYTLASSDRYSLGQEWDLTNTSDFYNGNLDELRIWNFAKTQSQIQTEMNNELTGSETGLISYYNMNQGIPFGNNTSEVYLIDSSPNSLNGSLNNFGLNGSTSNFITIDCSVLYPTRKPTTGLQKNIFHNMLSVYPNPVSNFLNINFEQLYNNVELKLYDIRGKLVFVQQYQNTNIIHVDVSYLPPSIYMAKLIYDSTVSDFKIIKE